MPHQHSSRKGTMLPLFLFCLFTVTKVSPSSSSSSAAASVPTVPSLEEEYLTIRRALSNPTTLLPITNFSSFPPVLLFLHASSVYMNHSMRTVHPVTTETLRTSTVLFTGASSSSSGSATVYENQQKLSIDNDYYAGISALAQLNKWSNNPIMTECYGKAYVWLRNSERSTKYYRGYYRQDTPGIMAIDILSSQSAVAVGLSRDLVILQEAYKKLYRYITYFQSSKTKLLSFYSLYLSSLSSVLDTLSSVQYQYGKDNFTLHHPFTFPNPRPHHPKNVSSSTSSTDPVSTTNASSFFSVPSLSMTQRRIFINFLNQVDTTIVHSIFVTEMFENFASIAEAIYQRANKSIHMCAERWLNQKQYEISQGIAVPHPIVTPHAHTVVHPEYEETFNQRLLQSHEERKRSSTKTKGNRSNKASSRGSKASSIVSSSVDTATPTTDTNLKANVPRPTDPHDILTFTEDALIAAEQMVATVESSGGFFNTGLDTIEYGITPYIYNLCYIRSIFLYTDPTIEQELVSGLPYRNNQYPHILNNLPSDFKFRPLYKLSSEYCSILDNVWDDYVQTLGTESSSEETSLSSPAVPSVTDVGIYKVWQWWQTVMKPSSPLPCMVSSMNAINESERYYHNWNCLCNETVRAFSNFSLMVPTNGEVIPFPPIDSFTSCLGENILNHLTKEIVDNLQTVYKSHDKGLTGDTTGIRNEMNNPNPPSASYRDKPTTDSEPSVRFS